jgi:phage minor structural protein
LSISVKQSNYFNAIQSLCETFEVWADFDIGHDDVGNVTSKKVIFKESIERPNYAGFRYGVNLKQSKRTIDSKAIVTKLIVPDNTNEFAPNGFCSIARAGANTSGENYIFDFSYYYNFH